MFGTPRSSAAFWAPRQWMATTTSTSWSATAWLLARHPGRLTSAGVGPGLRYPPDLLHEPGGRGLCHPVRAFLLHHPGEHEPSRPEMQRSSIQGKDPPTQRGPPQVLFSPTGAPPAVASGQLGAVALLEQDAACTAAWNLTAEWVQQPQPGQHEGIATRHSAWRCAPAAGSRPSLLPSSFRKAIRLWLGQRAASC